MDRGMMLNNGCKKEFLAVLSLILGIAAASPGNVLAQSADQFTYDALGRLIRVQTSNATTVYSYDAAGNRSVVSVTSINPVSKPNRPVVVVPSGSGFVVIPLKSATGQT